MVGIEIVLISQTISFSDGENRNRESRIDNTTSVETWDKSWFSRHPLARTHLKLWKFETTAVISWQNILREYTTDMHARPPPKNVILGTDELYKPTNKNDLRQLTDWSKSQECGLQSKHAEVGITISRVSIHTNLDPTEQGHGCNWVSRRRHWYSSEP